MHAGSIRPWQIMLFILPISLQKVSLFGVLIIQFKDINLFVVVLITIPEVASLSLASIF